MAFHEYEPDFDGYFVQQTEDGDFVVFRGEDELLRTKRSGAAWRFLSSLLHRRGARPWNRKQGIDSHFARELLAALGIAVAGELTPWGEAVDLAAFIVALVALVRRHGRPTDEAGWLSLGKLAVEAAQAME